ncbi:MAG: trypsin-like peptidase domain-containing protein [Halobacteriales archaeon]|nr:trypsin-like peptidase domain-containing protein [Halobacteriales archaeon]
MDRDGVSRREYLRSLAGVGTLLGAAGCAMPAGSRRIGTTEDADTGTMDSITTATPATDDTQRQAATAYTQVYRETVDSVVLLRVFDSFGRAGQGSGFVYDDRHIVTNEHVVTDAETVELRFNRGGWREPTVVGTDTYSDLAVLSVPDMPEVATPIPRIDSAPVVGQEVVTLGSPFGLEKSLSAGIVSGVNRTIPTAGNFTIPDAIQTDAAVNPGNSGGPLLTLDGEVAGVIRSTGGDNIGFAISAGLTERVVPSLIDTGEYAHPYMGVSLSMITPTIAEGNDLDITGGLLVVDVLNDGPAQGVLRGSDGETTVNGVEVPTGGDVIVRLGDRRITSMNELSSYLALRTSPGDTIPVGIIRNGQPRTVDLTLGRRPPPAQMA